jgi:lysophospholipase L1-like esterase
MSNPIAKAAFERSATLWGTLALLAMAASGAHAQGSPPSPQSAPTLIAEVSRDSKLPAIWIAGDSTAARDTSGTKQGWAVPFADYFDPAKIAVLNRAQGGRSSRTFITEGLWDKLMEGVLPGDIVLLQFGHNDAGALNDEPPPPLRARGTIPGLGPETREIDNVLTRKHEVVHTYGWYMRRMTADVSAKGAVPIILSPTVHDNWKDGRVERDAGHYSTWSAEIAKEAQLSYVDVNGMDADRFEKLCRERVHSFYPQDHTHFNAQCADIVAASVVSGLKGLHIKSVDNSLSAKGARVSADPARWAESP